MSKKIKIILVIFFVGCQLLAVSCVFAVNMDSRRFQIQGGSVDIGAGNTESSNFKLSTTLGGLAAGEFQKDGYIIKSGFQYIHSIIPFTFSISDTNIDFGPLEPNNPRTAKTDLTVSFGSAGQYQVTASENGPMRTSTEEETIPDTKCNGGKNACTKTLAKVWDSKSAYGFGYNLDGDDVPTDFKNKNYFRPFADVEGRQEPVVIMQNSNVQKTRMATATFKVNVSPFTATGTYQTIINFVATPSF